MKLIQNLKLLPDQTIATWLSQQIPLRSSDIFLAGPFDFSFHPFEICAWASNAFSSPAPLKTDITFTWRISIIDDEEKKALLNLRSSNRALLMLSELFVGLAECCSHTAFVIEKIEPEVENQMLCIRLQIPAETQGSLMVANALCLRTALDSLLFCRGLTIGASSFESKEESPCIALLKTIFLARL